MTEHTDTSEIEALLPWYVNRTLGPEERARVEAYLASTSEAAQRLAFLERIRDAVRDESSGSPGEFGLKRLKGRIRPETGKRYRDTTNRWRMIAAAAMLLLVVQGGVTLRLYHDAPGYRPLGSKPETAAIRVLFDESATEAEIRALLLETGFEIRSGPSAIGFYVLGLPDSATAERQEAALDKLRAASGVIDELVVETP